MKARNDHTSGLGRIIRDISLVAGYCWDRRWAERNAGNCSVNVTGMARGARTSSVSVAFKHGRRYPALGGQTILITRTGSRMRDIALDPGAGLCLLNISPDGGAYSAAPVIGTEEDLNPTTELAAHLAVHEYLVQSRSVNRVVLHTHPDETIALTHLIGCRRGKTLNRILLSMIPETVIAVPAGVACVPVKMPGSEEIADGTVKALRKTPVVLWEKHGALAVAPDIIEAFDLIDTVNKAARLYFLSLRSGRPPAGLTSRQVEKIRQHFHPVNNRKR